MLIYSPFMSSPVFWQGLAGFNSPVYLGGYPYILLTGYIYIKLYSYPYSPNEGSSLIRQVAGFWFSKKARQRLRGVYGKKFAAADSARF